MHIFLGSVFKFTYIQSSSGRGLCVVWKVPTRHVYTISNMGWCLSVLCRYIGISGRTPIPSNKQASKQNDLLHWITFDRHHLMSGKCYRWWGLCWEPTWWHGCQILKCWLWYSTCMYPPHGVPKQFLQGVIAGPIGPIYGVSGNQGESFDRAHLRVDLDWGP